MNKERVDVTIIGGGVIGLSCAYFAHRAGLTVRVLERDTFGAGASFGNMGLITPSHAEALCQPDNLRQGLRSLFNAKAPLKFSLKPNAALLGWINRFSAQCTEQRAQEVFRAKAALLQASRTLTEKLIKLEQLDCGFSNKGVLLVCRTDEGMEDSESLLEHCREAGVAAEIRTGKQLIEMEPALKDDMAGGLFFPGDALLRPDQFCNELEGVLLTKGIDLVDSCEVAVVHTEAGAVDSVYSKTKGLFPTKSVVICTGVHAGGLAKSLGVTLPLQPGKGYSLTTGRPNPCPEHGLILQERSMAITPWEDGYRIGGTMEFSGFDSHLNSTRLEMLVDGAMEYLVEPVAPGPQQKWAGLRPMTPDDLPAIGPAGPKGVFFACGHNMLGMSMAAATGRLVTEMLKGKKPHIDPTPYDPKRFASQYTSIAQRWWRERKSA